jgi:hypothetical protein
VAIVNNPRLVGGEGSGSIRIELSSILGRPYGPVIHSFSFEGGA